MKTLKTRSHLTNEPNRRAVLGGLGAVVLAGLPHTAQARTAARAEALIKQVVGEVLKIVNSNGSDASKVAQFERMFQRYGDVELIGRSLLGPAWRTANAADRKAYVSALSGYLSRKYGKRFREFRGAEIEIVNSTDFGNKGVVVETMVSTVQHRPFPVEWRVVEQGGKQTFFDLIIEGVRLISTEKVEIRGLLAKSGNSVSKLAAQLTRLG